MIKTDSGCHRDSETSIPADSDSESRDANKTLKGSTSRCPGHWHSTLKLPIQFARRSLVKFRTPARPPGTLDVADQD